MSQTFHAGDRVVITGGPDLVHGEITGKTQMFLGVNHYYVLIHGGSIEGLLCHPDGLRLEEKV